MNGIPDTALLVEQLRKQIADLESPEEPNFLKSDETLIRFLKSRDWDLEATERMLRKTITWRTQFRPFALECTHCRTAPGSHTLRQIGFDQANRPVIYATFYSAYPSQRNPAVEALTHLIYVFENAVRSMQPGVSQWVFVLDCAGMSAINCSPRLGYECAQVLSNHYPERLGLAICIRPGPMFKVAWQAIKPFLPIQTANKVCIVNSKSQLQPTLEQHFPRSIVEWLTKEYNLNRAEPKLSRYRPFWLHRPDTDESHDPRGDKPYVDNWVIKRHSSGHLPHPNMIDYLAGKLRSTANLMELNEHVDMLEDDEMAEVDEATAKKLLASLPSQYQIPVDAKTAAIN
ncbi:Phosphatidylinositol transfer protein 3 [Clonorchis sinensis]|uniref:Phosphatidylinositol transfer protein 3 n=1 Tax=Clonorchis sinensis TaxID=79923 RepID=A0A8T1MF12_CLOSI|nr:Phosphatidylinositol transfer protein 3 [Clonorchis sinensis]